MATTPKMYQRKAQFIEAEYASYKGKGNCRLMGRAFLIGKKGEVQFAAGNTVHLNPATSYSTEWFNALMSPHDKYRDMSEPDPRVAAYYRGTTADRNGYFEFRSLPPGQYYVVSHVDWTYRQPHSSGAARTKLVGVNIGRKVRLLPGESKYITLTR